MGFRKVLDSLIDFIYPHNCIFCGKPDCNLCEECIGKGMPPILEHRCHVCKQIINSGRRFVHTDCYKSTYLDGVFYCIKYTKAAKRYLSLIKYQFYFDLLREVIAVMQVKLAVLPFGYDFLVPVPLHKEREKWRGFNQAKKIAQGLSWNTKDVLIRVRMTKVQAQLSREDRCVNVKDAFQVVSPAQVKDKTILLVDDVFTTGSTLENCALALKSSGAKKVFAFTWAGG